MFPSSYINIWFPYAFTRFLVLCKSFCFSSLRKLNIMKPKSLYRSRAGRHFYGTENEIWAGFGPVGNTEKNGGAYYEQLLRVFFHVFRGKKII